MANTAFFARNGINANNFFIANNTVASFGNTASINATSIFGLTTAIVGANVVVNTTAYGVGNSTVNTSISATAFKTGNTTVNTNISATSSYISGNTAFGPNTTPAATVYCDGNYGVKATTLSAGNNFNINCALTNYYSLTCNGSAANIYFTNVPASLVFTLVLEVANGSANTISWANTPKWPSNTAPTASSNTDLWVFVTRDGGSTWRGTQSMKDTR